MCLESHVAVEDGVCSRDASQVPSNLSSKHVFKKKRKKADGVMERFYFSICTASVRI